LKPSRGVFLFWAIFII